MSMLEVEVPRDVASAQTVARGIAIPPALFVHGAVNTVVSIRSGGGS
jgi:hypothetical protein